MGLGDRTVNLPPTNQVSLGKVFYVVRQGTSNTLTIRAATGDTINASSSITMSGAITNQAYMIIQAGSTDWVAIKIS
jgi:hypothetical protein